MRYVQFAHTFHSFSWFHPVYAKHNGPALRNLFTQRFAAISTMTSLLVSSQVAVMFSPSRPTETARTALENLEWGSIAFWAGLFLALSIIFSMCSLLATLSVRSRDIFPLLFLVHHGVHKFFHCYPYRPGRSSIALEITTPMLY